MIKAKELRIGNWAYSPLMEGYFKISELTDERDPIGQPIKLTHEILSEVEWDKVDMFYNKGKLSLTALQPVFTAYWNSWKILEEVKYLHELQNIYFTLSGEELPVNLCSTVQ